MHRILLPGNPMEESDMILTWIIRALFVPLLVLSIVTSNCSAAEAAYTPGPELALHAAAGCLSISEYQ